MGNSMSTNMAGSDWPNHWLPRAYAIALHRKLSLAYLTKFTSCFPDAETVDDWCAYWGQGLANVTAEQIKHGLEYTTKNHEWPPTLAEFRAACLSLPKIHQALPNRPQVDAKKIEQSITAIKAMQTVRVPGRWWAKEILERKERGEYVHETALRFAKEAMQ